MVCYRKILQYILQIKGDTQICKTFFGGLVIKNRGPVAHYRICLHTMEMISNFSNTGAFCLPPVKGGRESFSPPEYKKLL